MYSQRRLVLILGIAFPLLSLLSNSAHTKVRLANDESARVLERSEEKAFRPELLRPNSRFGLLFNRLVLPAMTEVAWTQPFAISPQAGTTFTVNSTADPGTGGCDATECTLREAITAANAHAGTDTIAFDIPGAGPHIITPTSPLPVITVAGGPVNIDGYTQPGASVNTLADGDNAVLMIVLDGSAAGAVNMISISAGSSTIRGLVINHASGSRAINLDTNGSNTIEGNFLGTNVAGTAVSGNDYGVIVLSGSSNNTIGGTTPASRNIISGNNTGIALLGGPRNLIEGNLIGTDATGSNDLGNATGISVSASPNNTIGGTSAGARNVISGNSTGISSQADNNLIQGNYIGVSATGGAFNYANTSVIGISLFNGSGSIIGGTTPSARNVISGNSIGISLNSTPSPTVQGNFIGTDATGTVPLGNTSIGINMQFSNNTVIGGTSPGAGNLISANGTGMQLSPGISGAVIQIQGNLIGTDLTGTLDMGNAGDGIAINDSAARPTNITIGGTSAGARNVISGNDGDGIDLRAVSGTVVQGNLIGTKIDGTSPLGNGERGLNIVSASNTTVGGTSAGAGNRIAFNGAASNSGGGLLITGSSSNINVRGNNIFANTSNGTMAGGLGIDLSPSNIGDGSTANDSCDGDTGPNNLQNFPVLTSATSSGSTTTILGALNSTASTSFTIEFFSNPSCDPTGYGEGQTFLGSTAVTTDGSCNANFNVTLPVAVANGQFITATATDSVGNTSEFSQCFQSTRLNVITANNDSFSTDEDTLLNQPAPGVLSNDTSTDPATLNAQLVTGTTHGTLALNPNGSFTYTPAANYNGTDSFTYSASDGVNASNTATVQLNINAVNDAPAADPQSVTTDEDNAKAITLTASDVEGSALSYSVVTAPAHGTLSGTAPNLTYTPAADYNGADQFTFKVNDGQLDSNTATVSININAVNDPPIANSQSVTTDEDTAHTITLTGSDVEGSPLTFSIVTGPNHGALSGTAPNLTYTPDSNYNGADSFTFKTNDGAADSTLATVSITVNAVNDAPVAVNDTASTNENTPLQLAAPGVLSNDTDVDSPTLTAIKVNDPANGTLTLNPNGSFTYTPNRNFSGTDSFTYKANDGQLDSNVAAVTITINAVNSAPVAVDDSYTVAGNSVLTVSSPGVLSNDTDAEHDPLTASLVSGTAKGTLALNPDGSFAYTPRITNGTDSFTYRASDGQFDSNVATVSIIVTPPPTTVQFENALYQVQEDCTGIPVKVTRTGSLAATTTVDYMTADGTAEQRTDYTLASGRLTFAPGETTKIITLLISEDSFVEGPEFFNISLSNVAGGSLGTPGTATVQIIDDPTEPLTNAIDQKATFVCQHYHDFLNREPEPAGLLGWQEILSKCAPSDTRCDRIEVSSAFYRSDEFQQRGFFLYRFYATAFGRAPHYQEFMTDLSRTTGFLTDQQIEDGKTAFVQDFMSRQEFKNRYDSLTSPSDYVNALEAAAKVTLSNKQQLIDDLRTGRRTRTDVLRAVVESTEVSAKCFNEAFVVMQYFGYLRRDPDILYLEWIQTLNRTGDYRTLVNGFVNSLEYRSRFGPP